MSISERLIIFRQHLGLNQKQMAERLTIHPRNWSRYENGDVSLPEDVLLGLYGLGLNILWLYTGQGDMTVIDKSITIITHHPPISSPSRGQEADSLVEGAQPAKSQEVDLADGENGSIIESAPEAGGAPGSTSEAGKDTLKADVVRTSKTGGIPLIYPGDERLKKGIIIPYLEDQKASAGHGAELQDDDRPYRYLEVPAYLSHYPDLAMLPVRGDSMDPTLHDGDMVVCDSGGWDGDGVYVIKTSDEAFVKRVLHTPDGYQVVSDNKMYPGYLARNENLRIVGKVRAAVIQLPGRRGGI
ncbi:MAG: XRE family transcriptional regulator [Treponema sp.]|nr:XRE family transcriptional regulator [Treponema sp.]